MEREANDIEAFCNNARTIEEELECFDKWVAFMAKWGVPEPQILQSIPT